MVPHDEATFAIHRTAKFSVLSLTVEEWPPGEEAAAAGGAADDYGSDIPLGDLAVQVLLENMNLAPRDATVRAAALERIPLPAPLLGEFLTLEQDTSISKLGTGGTGGVVWNSAHAAAAYLGFMLPSRYRHRGNPIRVLEIGSGTGLLGITAAHLLREMQFSHAEVLLSDLRHVVPLIRRNADRNRASPVSVEGMPCDWSVRIGRSCAFFTSLSVFPRLHLTPLKEFGPRPGACS